VAEADPREYDRHIACAIQHLQDSLRSLSQTAQELRCEAARRGREGHWLEERICARIAEHIEQCELKRAAELLPWIEPARELSRLLPEEREALLPRILLDADVEAKTRKKIYGIQQRSRASRPGTTRPWVAQAIERRKRGERWSAIERALLPHRTGREANPGEAIRSAAARLKRVLKRHNISADK